MEIVIPSSVAAISIILWREFNDVAKSRAQLVIIQQMGRLMEFFRRLYRYHGVVMQRGGGKSDLTRHFADNVDWVVLDIDARVHEACNDDERQRLAAAEASGDRYAYELLFRQKARDVFDQVLRTFPGRRYVIVTSDFEILDFLQVPALNRRCYLPDSAFYGGIQRRIDDAQRMLYDQSRQLLIRQYGRAVRGYESFNSLYQGLSQWLGITARL